EVGGATNVGGCIVPGVAIAAAYLELAPAGVAIVDLAVGVTVHLRTDRILDDRLDLLGRGPDVGEHHGFALPVGSERFVAQVDVDAADEREGDDQRRGHQVVGPDLRVDATLEVAVAGQRRCDHQAALTHGLGYLGRQWARIADAGGAAVADDAEAQGVEVLLQAGALEIIGDDA